MSEDLSELDDFDDFFSTDPVQEELPQAELGPTLPAAKITPKKMVNSIMSVYEQLGGDAWLLTQAKSYPKEFLAILKSILPKDPEGASTPDLHITVLGRQDVPSASDPSLQTKGTLIHQQADGTVLSEPLQEAGEQQNSLGVTIRVH